PTREADVAERRDERKSRREDVHRNERSDEQCFVRRRIEHAPEISLLLARARETSVDVIGDRGGREQNERGQTQLRRLRERKRRNERRGRDACDGERVR